MDEEKKYQINNEIIRVVDGIKQRLLSRKIPNTQIILKNQGSFYPENSLVFNRAISTDIEPDITKIIYDIVYEENETESFIGKSLFSPVNHTVPRNLVCGGLVALYNEGPYFSFKYEGKVYYFSDYNNTKMFYESIINNMITNNCNIQCIQLSMGSLRVDANGNPNNKGHVNIVIICKENDNFLIALYEPHGTISTDNTFMKISNTFIDYFRYFVNKNTYYIPRIDISCLKGLQSYSEDKIGYCVTFSFFWYYCFLMVIRDINIDLSLHVFYQIIQVIERIIMLNFTKEELLQAIYAFANILTETFYLQHHKKIREEQQSFSSFYTQEQERLGTFMTHINRSKSVGNTKRFEQEFKESIFDETVQFSDGEDCKNNYECKSGNCCDGKCTPIYYYDTACDKDCECASGECRNSRCVVNSGP